MVSVRIFGYDILFPNASEVDRKEPCFCCIGGAENLAMQLPELFSSGHEFNELWITVTFEDDEADSEKWLIIVWTNAATYRCKWGDTEVQAYLHGGKPVKPEQLVKLLQVEGSKITFQKEVHCLNFSLKTVKHSESMILVV